MVATLFETNGAVIVAIPYNALDSDLYTLLDQINGVVFPGGGLELINKETGDLHTFTKTSIKIFEYAIK